jgi:hypothetical protein
MLFKPWRDEDKDLLGKHATYADAYTADQATYKARAKQYGLDDEGRLEAYLLQLEQGCGYVSDDEEGFAGAGFAAAREGWSPGSMTIRGAAGI